MSDVQPTDLIRNEQELLALTGAVDASCLADVLWQYVDGVVNLFDGGIDLQPGFQHEGLSYPFTLEELHEPLYGWRSPRHRSTLCPAPAPAVTLSKARVAKNAQRRLRARGRPTGRGGARAGLRVFAPRPMTTFAWWYEDGEATKLVVVVAPTEVSTVTDEVLAYALAWQHDRGHHPPSGGQAPWRGGPPPAMVRRSRHHPFTRGRYG